MYLYTVNAFPYGPFKGRTVKEQVYEPDWRTDERTQYTMNVAEILGDVAPAGNWPRPYKARRWALSPASPVQTWWPVSPNMF
jgi:hypothetical protein